MTTQNNRRTLNNYSKLLFSSTNLQMHVQKLDAKIKNYSCENWNLEPWSKISQGNKHVTEKLQFACFDDILPKLPYLPELPQSQNRWQCFSTYLPCLLLCVFLDVGHEITRETTTIKNIRPREKPLRVEQNAGLKFQMQCQAQRRTIKTFLSISEYFLSKWLYRWLSEAF